MTNRTNDSLSFNFQDFKKWMSDQEDLSKFFNLGMSPISEEDEMVGKFVVAKNDSPKIKVVDGDRELVLDEFLENGGTIADVNDKKFLIEVDGGCFYTHRSQIRIS